MRYDVAPFRLLIWLAAAVVGWAVVIGLCLYLPEGLAVLAVVGVVLWRKSQRPIDPTAPSLLLVPTAATTPAAAVGPSPTTVSRSGDDVRRLVARSA